MLGNGAGLDAVLLDPAVLAADAARQILSVLPQLLHDSALTLSDAGLHFTLPAVLSGTKVKDRRKISAASSGLARRRNADPALR